MTKMGGGPECMEIFTVKELPHESQIKNTALHPALTRTDQGSQLRRDAGYVSRWDLEAEVARWVRAYGVDLIDIQPCSQRYRQDRYT